MRAVSAEAHDVLQPNLIVRCLGPRLVLREVEGLSYKEIADSMDCPEGTVMSRLFHARRQMQQLLSDFAEDAEQEGAE